jgi:hypothetical protein
MPKCDPTRDSSSFPRPLKPSSQAHYIRGSTALAEIAKLEVDIIGR